MSAVLAGIRQDFLDGRRSYMLWGVVGCYVLLAAVLFYAVGELPDPATWLAIEVTAVSSMLILPSIAMLAGYLAIAGERESGTVRFLLGYPTSRATVVFGKAASRFAIVATRIVAGLAVGTGIASIRYPHVSVGELVAFAVLTLVFAAAFVGIAIGLSAAVASRARTMAGVIGCYVLFTMFWSYFSPVTVPDVIALLLGQVGAELPAWLHEVLLMATLPVAYLHGVEAVVGVETDFRAPDVTGIGGRPAALLGILLAWATVPVTHGYHRFRRADIG